LAEYADLEGSPTARHVYAGSQRIGMLDARGLRITAALCSGHLCVLVGDGQPRIVLARSGNIFYQPASDFSLQFVDTGEELISECFIELGSEKVHGVRLSAFPTAE